jgi:hypothetical protein
MVPCHLDAREHIYPLQGNDIAKTREPQILSKYPRIDIQGYGIRGLALALIPAMQVEIFLAAIRGDKRALFLGESSVAAFHNSKLYQLNPIICFRAEFFEYWVISPKSLL